MAKSTTAKSEIRVNGDPTTPGITNTQYADPGITNPGITNTSPDAAVLVNPGITNPGITNPGITNPGITNPGITNPGITNITLANGSITDLTTTIRNDGNTAAAYAIKLRQNSPPPEGMRFQLILHRRYTTPTAIGCDLRVRTQDVVVANIIDPVFINPGIINPGITNPGITNPGITNATISVAPGEEIQATLRIIDPDRSNNVTVAYTNPFTGVTTNVEFDPGFDPLEDVSTVEVRTRSTSVSVRWRRANIWWRSLLRVPPARRKKSSPCASARRLPSASSRAHCTIAKQRSWAAAPRAAASSCFRPRASPEAANASDGCRISI